MKDDKVFQHWKAVRSNPIDSLYANSFKKESGAVIDFGEHLTGYCGFSIEGFRPCGGWCFAYKIYLREVPSELAISFDPYPGGFRRHGCRMKL